VEAVRLGLEGLDRRLARVEGAGRGGRGGAGGAGFGGGAGSPGRGRAGPALEPGGGESEERQDADRRRIKERLKEALDRERRREQLSRAGGEGAMEFLFGVCAADPKAGKAGSRSAAPRGCRGAARRGPGRRRIQVSEPRALEGSPWEGSRGLSSSKREARQQKRDKTAKERPDWPGWPFFWPRCGQGGARGGGRSPPRAHALR
jgi:hypothetical protein